MTPKQIRESSVVELVEIYKNKARCYHSEQFAGSIYKELEKRLGSDRLYGIRLEVFHLQNGEGDAMFNTECDKLIKVLEGAEYEFLMRFEHVMGARWAESVMISENFDVKLDDIPQEGNATIWIKKDQRRKALKYWDDFKARIIKRMWK